MLLESTRLKRKEANIDDWQKSKITLARNEMTKTEVCLLAAFILPRKKKSTLVSTA